MVEKAETRSDSSSNRKLGKGKDQGGRGGDRSASPKQRIITDLSKLCKGYLAGKCKYGDKCKFHHNGPCKFHARGACTRGDDCPFSHHAVLVAPASAVADAPASKKAQAAAAKAKAENA